MRIESVDVFVLRHQLADVRGPASAWYDSRSSILVRLKDEDGVTGWGETYAGAGLAATISELGRGLIGGDPFAVRSHWLALAGRSRNGFAVAPIAIALDDLRARRLGVPVSTLYGGAVRNRVRAYASSGGYYRDVDPEESWLAETARFVEQGFSAVKLRIGRYEIARELRNLARVRESLPAGLELMADGNGAYTLPQAIVVGRELERLGFRWFEEPLTRLIAGSDYPGYTQLADTLDIAVAAGEGLQTRSAFAAFIADRKADIVQPDVAICSGIGETLLVAEIASLAGMSCVPHAWGGAVLMAATLQVLAVIPDVSEVPLHAAPLLEFDTFENPLLSRLAHGLPRLVDGYVDIPAQPGLGIDVDIEFVERTALETVASQ
ncbi:MAG: mandelate racemase/muconate lactonizing enzyme family protein [Gaiellaceae bacterium]